MAGVEVPRGKHANYCSPRLVPIDSVEGSVLGEPKYQRKKDGSPLPVRPLLFFFLELLMVAFKIENGAGEENQQDDLLGLELGVLALDVLRVECPGVRTRDRPLFFVVNNASLFSTE